MLRQVERAETGLEEFRAQIPDAVPVNDDIHPLFGRPRHALIQQLQITLLSLGTPCGRMHGKPDDVCAPGLGGGKVILVPMLALAEFVRIARAKTAKDDRLSVGVNEAIAFDGNPGELRKRGGG